MKISQEVRDAAKGRNDWSPDQGLSTAEIRAAMEKKAAEFRDHGGEIYLPKDAAE
jgi:phosphomethylpyrimidine synthase